MSLSVRSFHVDKTWVALNFNSTSWPGAWELDLEPKGGRGEKSTEEFKIFLLGPARVMLGAQLWGGCPLGSPPWRGVLRLRVSGCQGPW